MNSYSYRRHFFIHISPEMPPPPHTHCVRRKYLVFSNSKKTKQIIKIDAVHKPTNALFISSVKSFKFSLKYTIISLLHVSVLNDNHQGDISVYNQNYIYDKTLCKITSLYILGDVVACRRAACVLCAVQSETVERHVCCVQCRVRL